MYNCRGEKLADWTQRNIKENIGTINVVYKNLSIGARAELINKGN